MVDQDAAPIPYDSMGFDPRLEAGFHSLGFEGTRPVQGAVIPIALEGHDVVACAETGTGKTLAFAVPIIERLLSATPGYGDPAREAVGLRSLGGSLDFHSGGTRIGWTGPFSDRGGGCRGLAGAAVSRTSGVNTGQSSRTSPRSRMPRKRCSAGRMTSAPTS